MVIEKKKTNERTKIDKIIAVMSGKGGVGKSTVTSLAAAALRKKGFETGVLDADITGPSIPKLFGINERRAATDESGIYTVETSTGIRVASLNLLIDEEEKPVIWRAPLITSTIKQFYTDVYWGELDYLLIDLPPGTGDVPLTIMQSIPVDGIIIVSSPQKLVQLIVKKSVKMAKTMGVKVIGLVENMSYVKCSHCGEMIKIFGDSGIEELSKNMELPVIAKLPIDPEFARLCDEGKLESSMDMNFVHKEEAFKIADKIASQ